MRTGLLSLLLLCSVLSFAQANPKPASIPSVTTLPVTCDPGGGVGGRPADHIDLWNGASNIPYFCIQSGVWEQVTGTDSYTQNTIPRFSALGTITPSGATDSGSQYAYGGVSGFYGYSMNTVCQTSPCPAEIGIPLVQTIPGGVSGKALLGGDPTQGLLIVNSNSTGNKYLAGDGPIIYAASNTGAISSTLVAPSLGYPTVWQVDVYLNELPVIASCAGTGTAVASVNYTDTSGSIQSQTLATLTFASSGTPKAVGFGFFRLIASATMSYAVAFTGGTGCTYDATFAFSRKF